MKYLINFNLTRKCSSIALPFNHTALRKAKIVYSFGFLRAIGLNIYNTVFFPAVAQVDHLNLILLSIAVRNTPSPQNSF